MGAPVPRSPKRPRQQPVPRTDRSGNRARGHPGDRSASLQNDLPRFAYNLPYSLDPAQPSARPVRSRTLGARWPLRPRSRPLCIVHSAWCSAGRASPSPRSPVGGARRARRIGRRGGRRKGSWRRYGVTGKGFADFTFGVNFALTFPCRRGIHDKGLPPMEAISFYLNNAVGRRARMRAGPTAGGAAPFDAARKRSPLG